MLGKQTFDLDRLVSLLKADKPLSLGSFANLGDSNENAKILVLFALPEILPEIEVFCKELLEKHTKKIQNILIMTPDQRNEIKHHILKALTDERDYDETGATDVDFYTVAGEVVAELLQQAQSK